MITEIIVLLVVMVGIFFLYKMMKNIFLLVINSVIGVFALMGFNFIFGTGVAINFWTVLITVIGGIFGFIIVLILHFTGVAF